MPIVKHNINLEDVFIAFGGSPDLQGKISYKTIQETLKSEPELASDIEKSLRKICNNKEEISFDEFIKFFQ
jgi:hypothetical protein